MSTSFGEAIKLGFANYFNFSGVARRSEYWWFFLFLFLGSFATGLLDGLLFGAAPVAFGASTATRSDMFSPISALFFYATLIPAVSIYVRRLRDSGRHWVNILWLLVPIAGIIIWIYQLTQPTQHLAHETYGYTSRD